MSHNAARIGVLYCVSSLTRIPAALTARCQLPCITPPCAARLHMCHNDCWLLLVCSTAHDTRFSPVAALASMSPQAVVAPCLQCSPCHVVYLVRRSNIGGIGFVSVAHTANLLTSTRPVDGEDRHCRILLCLFSSVVIYIVELICLPADGWAIAGQRACVGPCGRGTHCRLSVPLAVSTEALLQVWRQPPTGRRVSVLEPGA